MKILFAQVTPHMHYAALTEAILGIREKADIASTKLKSEVFASGKRDLCATKKQKSRRY